MPTADRDSLRLHYELSAPRGHNVLVLINSLGADLHMWDKALPRLEPRTRVLRYDVRGHGHSSASPAPLTLAELGHDLVFLLDHCGFERVDLCGISLGGLIAMWMAIHAPERVGRAVLANTAARIGSAEAWQQRMTAIETSGMAALVESTPLRWFTQAYCEQFPEEMERVRAMVASTDAASYAACCGVLRDTDLRGEVRAIGAPCLIVTGTHDAATPPSDGRALQAALPDTRYLEMNCSHLSAWERPEEFSRAVLSFLSEGEDAHG